MKNEYKIGERVQAHEKSCFTAVPAGTPGIVEEIGSDENDEYDLYRVRFENDVIIENAYFFELEPVVKYEAKFKQTKPIDLIKRGTELCNADFDFRLKHSDTVARIINMAHRRAEKRGA